MWYCLNHFLRLETLINSKYSLECVLTDLLCVILVNKYGSIYYWYRSPNLPLNSLRFVISAFQVGTNMPLVLHFPVASTCSLHISLVMPGQLYSMAGKYPAYNDLRAARIPVGKVVSDTSSISLTVITEEGLFSSLV